MGARTMAASRNLRTQVDHTGDQTSTGADGRFGQLWMGLELDGPSDGRTGPFVGVPSGGGGASSPGVTPLRSEPGGGGRMPKSPTGSQATAAVVPVSS